MPIHAISCHILPYLYLHAVTPPFSAPKFHSCSLESMYIPLYTQNFPIKFHDQLLHSSMFHGEILKNSLVQSHKDTIKISFFLLFHEIRNQSLKQCWLVFHGSSTHFSWWNPLNSLVEGWFSPHHQLQILRILTSQSQDTSRTMNWKRWTGRRMRRTRKPGGSKVRNPRVLGRIGKKRES